jgi:hypothetical protein
MLFFQLSKKGFRAIDTLCLKAEIILRPSTPPHDDVPERAGCESAGTPLCHVNACDHPPVFEYFGIAGIAISNHSANFTTKAST